MKKISLFLVLALTVSLCGCTFAPNKEPAASLLTGEELASYNSLIKSRFDSKSFLRYDMKYEAYDCIKYYVLNLLNETKSADLPYYCQFSQDESKKYFQFCVSFEELSLSDLIDDISYDNNFSNMELLIIPHQLNCDENSIMEAFDIAGSNISVSQNQFEVSENTYFTIKFEK